MLKRVLVGQPTYRLDVEWLRNHNCRNIWKIFKRELKITLLATTPIWCPERAHTDLGQRQPFIGITTKRRLEGLWSKTTTKLFLTGYLQLWTQVIHHKRKQDLTLPWGHPLPEETLFSGQPLQLTTCNWLRKPWVWPIISQRTATSSPPGTKFWANYKSLFTKVISRREGKGQQCSLSKSPVWDRKISHRIGQSEPDTSISSRD